MAKAKFNKLNDDKISKITHADLQISEQKKIGRPKGSKIKKEQANIPLSVALTATQKQQLQEYAKKDDRTAGYVIKKLLIDKGIIEPNE